MKVYSTIVFLFLISFIFAGCGNKPAPEKALPTIYVIPSGKTGWVKILYNRRDEKPLPVENGFAIARIGQDLKVYTRSSMNPVWDGSQFYVESPDGKRVRLIATEGDTCQIWGQEKFTDENGGREEFFVGDQQQFSMNLKMPKNVGSGFPETPVDPQGGSAPGQASDPSRVLTDLPK